MRELVDRGVPVYADCAGPAAAAVRARTAAVEQYRSALAAEPGRVDLTVLDEDLQPLVVDDLAEQLRVTVPGNDEDPVSPTAVARRRTRLLVTGLPGAGKSPKAAQLGERMLAGCEWQDEDLAFARPNGRPVDRKPDHDDWARLLRCPGVRHVRLHDGRHSAATLLLGENVRPRVVMELLGHSRMRTTMDVYSHVMPALAREAADRMGGLLLPGEGGRTTTRDDSGRSAEGERPGHRVEPRGLEPLTPTLPGRLSGVQGGTPEFICAGQKVALSSADSCGRP
ncbi:tyrosine-type recombinase/integrase [Geodermatophilus sp. DSM 45219]|uniref:tyrosine-type recombinase/integrase n=1 Tax=Geodermatophilus sp. DSM 45219 TaxID=1881103 RepID=UPI000882897F|nr:tyrosine-type recombinase/integrase [Geodermatophilus sp. DSM 45219]SDO61103.1 Phage integrase family protein [Geodermatophilus sp. DSM 45219]